MVPGFSWAQSPDGRIPVAATFSILGEFVRQVGGDRIQVTVLVGPNGDAHAFEPLPGDMRALMKARLIFENGLGFEPWLDRLGQPIRARCVLVTNGIRPRPFALGSRSVPDPHVWQDAGLAARMVENIRDALAASDPTHAAEYRRQAEAYRAQLSALDAWIRAEAEKIPPARRTLVTSHDTLGYFSRAYGFTLVGTVMGSGAEGSEPSARQLSELAGKIRALQAPALFTENIRNPGLMRKLADETGVRVVTTLYTDALGEPGSGGGDYLSMMRHNVREITGALR